MSKYKTKQHAHGYTLIELLVVVSIMIISVAIIIPSINKFVELTTDNTAKNAFSVACTVIRAYAPTSTDGLNSQATSSTYDGVALIVTPADELRLTQNNQFLLDNTNAFMEDLSLNAYSDINDRDYISLPKDTGILGIYKPTNSDKLVLPPFAIRFDEKGQLAVTDSTDATTFVYYDANNDDIINISTGNGKDRANPYPDGTEYIIDEWAPKQSTANTGNGATESYKLPFEKLEAVVGVIIFSKRELREDGGVFPGILTFTSNSTNSGCGFDSNNIALGCATLQDWLERHGEVLFFSRYTGALLKHK